MAAAAPTLVVSQGLLAERAPGLLKTLCEHEPDFVLLDGTLAGCDRVGDGRADYSHKHRPHGVNVQVATDPGGWLLWLSPALPGRTHDPAVARARGIVQACLTRQILVLADHAYQGADAASRTPYNPSGIPPLRPVILSGDQTPASPRPIHSSSHGLRMRGL